MNKNILAKRNSKIHFKMLKIKVKIKMMIIKIKNRIQEKYLKEVLLRMMKINFNLRHIQVLLKSKSKDLCLLKKVKKKIQKRA